MIDFLKCILQANNKPLCHMQIVIFPLPAKPEKTQDFPNILWLEVGFALLLLI